MMNAKQISQYLGRTTQNVYVMAANYNWKKTGEFYHVTENDLDVIKNNPRKRGRKFGCKVPNQVRHHHHPVMDKFDASALESVFKTMEGAKNPLPVEY